MLLLLLLALVLRLGLVLVLVLVVLVLVLAMLAPALVVWLQLGELAVDRRLLPECCCRVQVWGGTATS